MRSTWRLVAMTVVCAGLHAGCGEKKETTTTPLTGPKKVAVDMMTAREAGDGAAMAECYDCSIEDKEYLIKTMPYQKTISRLIDAGAKAYGKEAWVEATKNAKIGMIKVDVKTAARDMMCEITGDEAKCILRGLPRALILRKKGDRWLIVPAPGRIPPLSTRGEALKSMMEAKKAIDAIIPKVSAGTVPIDDMCREIRKIVRKD